jgi:FdhD protein
MLKEYPCIRLDDEKAEISMHKVVEEVPLSIFINGRHFATAMTSPDARREFVIGHLFSERIVRSCNEIESLEIEGNIARAIVANP